MIYDSIIVTGSAQVSGSLSVTGGITGSFQGTATTASYVLNAVSSSFATTASYAVSASIATNAVTASHALNAVSSSFATSAANAVTASHALNATTASHALNAVSASFATTAVTSSFANAFTVAGTLTATTLVVQTITSSVDFVTGSTRFGSLLANTHAFTGSVGMTGSLAVAGAGTFSNTLDVALNVGNSQNGLNLVNNAGSGYGNSINFYQSATKTAQIFSESSVANTSEMSFRTMVGSTLATRMFINPSGSVGIGTTSPEGILTVQGTSLQPPTSGTTANSLLQLKGSLNNELNIGCNTVTGDYGAYIQVSDNNLAVNYPLNLQPNGGNVGIGTNSTTTKLTIDNSANANTNHIDLIGNSSAGAKGHLGSFGGGTYLTSNYYYASGQNNDTGSLGQGAVIIGTSATAGSSSISFALSDPGATSPSTKVNILSNGNVGIGTTTPITALEVLPSITNSSIKTGGIEIQSYAVNNSWIGDNMYYSGSWKARATGYSTNVYFGQGTINFTRAASTGSGATIFPISSMLIDASGKVGIGYDAPDFPLSVFGTNISQGDSSITAHFVDKSSFAAGVGGGIAFGGYFASSTYANSFAYIQGIKENATSGDYAGALKFGTRVNGGSVTERMRITSDGYLRLAGAGIQFNGDTAAANSLDDYEEGTWTPTIDTFGGTPTTTYTNRGGTYTRIGNMVYAFFDFTASSISGGSGGAIISGLPFTVSNTQAGYSVAQWRDSGAIAAGAANTVLKGFADRGYTHIYIQIDNTGSAGFAGASGTVTWNSSGRSTGFVIYQA